MKKLAAVGKDGEFKPSARIVDGTLVLSLPDAETAIVWRLDLGQTKASALEVRAKDDRHVLILRTPKGDVHEIAPYATQPGAVRALMAVSEAMESAHGQLQPASIPRDADGSFPAGARYPRARRPLRFGGSFLKFLLNVLTLIVALLILAAMVIFINSMGARRVAAPDSPAVEGSAAPAPSASPPSASGVPESADSFLQRNQ